MYDPVRGLVLILAIWTQVCTGSRPRSDSSKESRTGYIDTKWPDQQATDSYVRHEVASSETYRNFPWSGPSGHWGSAVTFPPRRPRPSRRPSHHEPRPNPLLKPYPFESEVRGEGFHSTIRFNPFSQSRRKNNNRDSRNNNNGQRYSNYNTQNRDYHYGSSHEQTRNRQRSRPKGQTYGNWGHSEYQPPRYSSDEFQPYPQATGSHSTVPELTVPELDAEDPKQFYGPPPPATGFQEQVLSTDEELQSRPFVHTGNLAGFVEGSHFETDGNIPIATEVSNLEEDTEPHTDFHDVGQEYQSEDGKGGTNTTEVPTASGGRLEKFMGSTTSRPSQSHDSTTDGTHLPRLPGKDPSVDTDATEFATDYPPAENEEFREGISTTLPPFNNQDPAFAEDVDGYYPVDYTTELTDATNNRFDDTYYDELYDEFMDIYYDEAIAETTTSKYSDDSSSPSPSMQLPSLISPEEMGMAHEEHINSSPSLSEISPPDGDSPTTKTDQLSPQSPSHPTSRDSMLPPLLQRPVPTSPDFEEPSLSSPSSSSSSSPVQPPSEPEIKELPPLLSTLQPQSTTTSSTTISTTTQSTTISTTPSTTTVSTTTTTTTTEKPPVISLSEILQGLQLGLPQFLGSLKTHGLSLKNFTAKVQEKGLTQKEFRRAKGNLDSLLEILKEGRNGGNGEEGENGKGENGGEEGKENGMQENGNGENGNNGNEEVNGNGKEENGNGENGNGENGKNGNGENRNGNGEKNGNGNGENGNNGNGENGNNGNGENGNNGNGENGKNGNGEENGNGENGNGKNGNGEYENGNGNGEYENGNGNGNRENGNGNGEYENGNGNGEYENGNGNGEYENENGNGNRENGNGNGENGNGNGEYENGNGENGNGNGEYENGNGENGNGNGENGNGNGNGENGNGNGEENGNGEYENGNGENGNGNGENGNGNGENGNGNGENGNGNGENGNGNGENGNGNGNGEYENGNGENGKNENGEKDDVDFSRLGVIPHWLTARPTWRPPTTTTSTTTDTTQPPKIFSFRPGGRPQFPLRPDNTEDEAHRGGSDGKMAKGENGENTNGGRDNGDERKGRVRQEGSRNGEREEVNGEENKNGDKNGEDKNGDKNGEEDKNGEHKESMKEGENGDKNPIPITLDLAGMLKEKGLKPSEMLHDLGSLFTVSESEAPGTKSKNETSKNAENMDENGRKEVKNGEKPDEGKNITEGESVVGSSTLKPYYPESPVSLKPYRPPGGRRHFNPYQYRPGGGAERGIGGGGGRRIITSRHQTTERTTLIPPYKYKPPPSTTSDPDVDVVQGVDLQAGDSNHVHEERNANHNEFRTNTEKDNVKFSSKSAIMAATILGGVTVCVFLAILVVVMYKGRARFHRRRRSPMSLPSDASTSSTPPLYPQRALRGASMKKGKHKTSGFWGTLKKRFDPYSLSSTPSTMT